MAQFNVVRILHTRIQSGDLENQKNIGFRSNTCPEPLKVTKLSSQHSMLGYHRYASETPFKWRFAGGPMMARLYWYLDPPSFIKETKRKKNCQSWTPSDKTSGSAHFYFNIFSQDAAHLGLLLVYGRKPRITFTFISRDLSAS